MLNLCRHKHSMAEANSVSASSCPVPTNRAESTPGRLRGRKRVRNMSEWKQVKQKVLRNSGQGYKNKKEQTSKYLGLVAGHKLATINCICTPSAKSSISHIRSL